jgi:hypothetical protein
VFVFGSELRLVLLSAVIDNASKTYLLPVSYDPDVLNKVLCGSFIF